MSTQCQSKSKLQPFDPPELRPQLQKPPLWCSPRKRRHMHGLHILKPEEVSGRCWCADSAKTWSLTVKRPVERSVANFLPWWSRTSMLMTITDATNWFNPDSLKDHRKCLASRRKGPISPYGCNWDTWCRSPDRQCHSGAKSTCGSQEVGFRLQ